MFKQKRILSSFVIASLLLIFGNSQLTKLEAKERMNKMTVKQIVEEELRFNKKTTVPRMGTYLTYQNLIYGFATEGNFTKTNPGSPGTPFIALKDGDEMVHSIYKDGSGWSSSAINLYIGPSAQTNYVNKSFTPFWSGQAITNQKLNSETGEITADIVEGRGFKSSLPLPFKASSGTARMYAQQGVIMQEFTYKNEGNVAVEVTPTKQVDTMLGEDDEVPIYSRGPNKGMYMQDSDKKYRLDYMTDVEDGPVAYAANFYETPFSDSGNFGTDIKNPLGQNNTAANLPLMQPDFDDPNAMNDTGMFLVWKTKVVKPGETYTFKYGTGLKLGADFMVEKSATNQTQASGKNDVGDTMKFTVDLSTKKKITKVEVVETVPEDVSKPTEIQYVDEKGTIENYPVADVYDEKTRQIKLNIPSLDVKGGSLSYKVLIESEAEGKQIVSSVVATGIDYNNELVKTQSFYDLIVEKLPLSSLTIKYLDEQGELIIPSMTKDYKVGQPYLARVEDIDGFNYQRTEGVAEGIMDKSPVVVEFYYNTHQFTLNQKVMNSIGKEVTTIFPSEELFFQIDLDSYLSDKTPPSYYDDFSMTIPVDPALINIKGLELIQKSTQKEIGEITYDAKKNEIKAKLLAIDKIQSSSDLLVRYQGTVDAAILNETTIKGNAYAQGRYTGIPAIIARPKNANEVSVKVVDMAKLSIMFMSEEGEIAETITREVQYSTIYDLAADEEVQQNVSELKKNYELVEEPKDGKILISAEHIQVSFRFEGLLKLYSAPKGLNFGNKGQPIGNVVYQNPKLVGDQLIVSDTRSNRVKWRLTAKLDKPLTSEENSSIIRPNAIQYQNSTEVKVLNDQETTIVTHMNEKAGNYNISKERWNENEGFLIRLGQGAITTLGRYQAKITITLENAR